MFSCLRQSLILRRLASTQAPNKESPMARVQALAKSMENKHALAGAARATDGVKYGDEKHQRPDLARLRIIPRDSAFYMANPPHEEVTRRLNSLIQAHIKLPVVAKADAQPVTWMSLEDYRSKVGGTRLRPSQYKEFLKLANRLHRIEPQLMPSSVDELLSKLKSDKPASAAVSLASKRQLNADGAAIAVGHRKTSSARVTVTQAHEGTVGQIMVNGMRLDEYFPQQIHRQKIAYPLSVIESAGKYNVFATVQGGGSNGQADAVAHGLGLALRIQNPLLSIRLRKAGCTKRDLRLKERKKPGLAKARKAYTWVKR